MGRKLITIWLSLAMVFGLIVIVNVTMDFTLNVGGTTLYVNTTGSGGAYTSIQDAINNANPGDTVFVYNGTYYERIIVNRSINLTGEEEEFTIIDGGGTGDVVSVTENWVNITNFKVTNSGNNWGYSGIELVLVENCSVYDNIVYNNYNGITLKYSDYCIVTGNNISLEKSYGIYIQGSIVSIVSNNTMDKSGIFIDGTILQEWNSHEIDNTNTVNGKQLIYLKDQTGVTIPLDAGQVILANCTQIEVKNLDMSDSSTAIELGFSSNINITNNNATPNNIDGIYLYESDNNNISGNDASSNRYPIHLDHSNDNIIINNNASKGYFGIYIGTSHKNTILRNKANSCDPIGIFLSSSNENILSNNTIIGSLFSNDDGGIQLSGSSKNTLTNNTMINNGIMISGTRLEDWNTHNIDISNTVNGKPVNYIKNQTGGPVLSDPGQIILANSKDITIENKDLSSSLIGIELGFSTNCTIINNNVSKNLYGIGIFYSWSNNISSNNATNSNCGIYLTESINNNVFENRLSGNIWGINIHYSDENNITDNIASSSTWSGIYLSNSNGNTIYKNNATNNGRGIELYSSLNNMVYHNNIITNTVQALDYSNSGNRWDNGYPRGGNYWSNYAGPDNYKGPKQDIQGSDGIGDTKYVIDSDSNDRYPLKDPFTERVFENYTVLKEGWNLISIPLIQVDQNLTKILETIDGYYNAIQWYDITDINDPWKHHKIGKPFGNDLFELNETMSFWIHITQPGDTIFLYNGTTSIVNQTIQLHKGWNMVGYPSLSSYNRTVGLNSLSFDTHVDAIQWFDASTQTWHFMGPNDSFVPGRGYWVHSKVEAGWEVPL